MSGRIALVLILILFLALWVVRLSGRARRPIRVDTPHRAAMAAHREALAARRRAVGWRWVGLALGVVAAVLTTKLGSLGLGVMLAPTVFGLCVIAGVIVGELATTPGRHGARTAALETRRVGDYLPRRLGGMVAASTLGLGALLVTTTLMGSVDAQGHASLSRQCSPEMTASHGPWPGLFYSLPLGMAVVFGLLVAAVALRTVVLRPRSGSDLELVAADDLLRRRSAEAVVAAAGVMVATSLAGVALTTGSSLLGIACPPTSWVVLGFAVMGVAALMLMLAIWCFAVLLSGSRILPVELEDAAFVGHPPSS